MYGCRGREMTVSILALFDDAPSVHHGHAMRDLPDDGQVVRDEEVVEPAVALKLEEQVEDLRLHRDVERRDRLVADQERGSTRQRAGDADALPLPAARTRAGSGSRIAGSSPTSSSSAPTRAVISWRGTMRWISRPSATAAPIVSRGIERAVRVLEDDLHPPSHRAKRLPVQSEQVLSFEVAPCRKPVRSEPKYRAADDWTFPQPDSPTSASVSPGCTSRLTPLTA